MRGMHSYVACSLQMWTQHCAVPAHAPTLDIIDQFLKAQTSTTKYVDAWPSAPLRSNQVYQTIGLSEPIKSNESWSRSEIVDVPPPSAPRRALR